MDDLNRTVDGGGVPAIAGTPPPSTVKLAVIGTGWGQLVQSPGFRAAGGFEIVAVAGARAERARAVAAELGIPHAVTDYKALLRLHDLDAASIVTPPHLHAPMALAALAAGKHVLCEKPFAVTVAEAVVMAETARRTGLAAMVDFEWRFLPGRQRLGELIAEGYIGEPR